MREASLQDQEHQLGVCDLHCVDEEGEEQVNDFRIEKEFWKSKRFWWNILTLGLGVLGGLGDAGVISGQAMAVINPVGNMILNQVTDGAILKVRPQ